MVIIDNNLIAALKTLTPAEQRLVARHVAGDQSEAGAEILRMLRRKLKRKVRARVPKLKWLA